MRFDRRQLFCFVQKRQQLTRTSSARGNKMKNAASLLIFLCITAAFGAVNVFKTAVIKDGDSQLVINIADHQFLRIYNFTQEGGSTRGVVIAAAAAPTATPVPTATPTATPPTPTPTATSTATPTPTATPPPRAVLTASIVDPASPPEPIKQVVVDGPAQVTVQPVTGATLVLTYIKTPETTPTPTPEPIIGSTATPTPTATP